MSPSNQQSYFQWSDLRSGISILKASSQDLYPDIISNCAKRLEIEMLTNFTRVARITPVRFVQTGALSKASIVDLPHRWEAMPAPEQQEIVSKLADRQKLAWNELTDTEKKAAWYISYGEWGPRRPVHGKGDASYIAKGVAVGVALSVGIFALVRLGAGDPPKTMNKSWQLQSDEYLKSKNANPWGGYSQVQSK